MKGETTMRKIYFSNDGSVSAKIEGRGEKRETLFSVKYKYPDGSWSYEEYEEHDIQLYAWARGLHGNAPSGTPYGYFRASRNGKRVIITV